MGKRTGRRRALIACLAAAMVAVMLGCLVASVATGAACITSAARPVDRFAASIPRYRSQRDRDGDGIDDQTDILDSALAYVQTRPRYRSAYYAGGYPDDGCGVCTDVVAFALRGAGFDLRALMAEDIAAAPEAYGIFEPDADIDFRRVPNVRVYLERHAEALTCDTADINAWQGGDVVVYDGHVGIVSDRRNADGVPYLIHQASPFQLAYEEDALASFGEVVGHYRLG
ncbi:DUF1287 domain-containing protein [[Collinsella] massiliensis]|uniref:DUF1287 domain-containing protein n=1 Tax=[Collinsella] massiliensis TaxID=1232426 RepID=A0A1Y3XSL7_9ACTN|nr:DUF1287 domain-containing protein [[Collinsella] massiliensis]OUN88493.1 DUF1287 domain-containing protein [[Collinsella] massiliensis]